MKRARFAPLVLLSVSMFALEVSSVIQINQIVNGLLLTVGWLLLGVYIVNYSSTNPRVFFTSVYQSLYFVSLLVGASVVSLGAYMFEIQEHGSANGSFWLAVFFFVLGCECTILGFRAGYRDVVPQKNIRVRFWDRSVAHSVIVAIVAIAFLILLRYGGAYSYEGTRINFWGEVAPKGLSFIRILLILTFFLVSALWVTSSRRTVSHGATTVYVALYIFLAVFLLGEKFSLFTIYLSSLAFALAIPENVRSVKRVLVWGAIVLLGLIGLVAISYHSSGLGAWFVVARLALQGQILWSALEENFSTIVLGSFGGADIQLGLATLRGDMGARYLPPLVQAAHEKSGTTLSGYAPAWQVLIFGLPLAAVFHAGCSFLFGLLQSSVVLNVQQGKYLYGFLLFATHFFLLSAWYIGNFNVIWMIATLCLLFGFGIIAPRRRLKGP